jgi:hypothetical protein
LGCADLHRPGELGTFPTISPRTLDIGRTQPSLPRGPELDGGQATEDFDTTSAIFTESAEKGTSPEVLARTRRQYIAEVPRQPVRLSTARLSLRQPAQADALAILGILANPSVVQHNPSDLVTELEDVEAW